MTDERPGWEWQQNIEHRRWIEEYEHHLQTDNLTRQQIIHTAQATATERKPTMRISEEFSGSWLKAIDLHGRRVSVVIDNVRKEEIGQGEDREFKPVVYFKGKEKGLVLNKTNATTIADFLGDDTDNWAGHAIVLYPARVQFGAKMVEAIRVDVSAVEQKPAAPTPAHVPASASTHGVPESDVDGDIPF